MSCAANKGNFRLLDAYVGWDASARDITNLVGIDDPAGLSLALVDPAAVDPAGILAYILPARLARGCSVCEWYLATPAPPESLILHRDACQPEWQSLWTDVCAPEVPRDIAAVAAWRRLVAVSDRAAGRVLVWADRGRRLIAEIDIRDPGPIAFSPAGELLVATGNSREIRRFGLDGFSRAPAPTAPDNVWALAVDSAERVWVVTRQGSAWGLLRAGPGDNRFSPVTVAELALAFPPSGLVAAADTGFCVDDGAVVACFSWYGRNLEAKDVPSPAAPRRQTQGQLLTLPLDSGIPRCRWHRVRVDADVPVGTALSFAVASAEDFQALAAGNSTRDAQWRDFPAGVPHFSDWTTAPPGATDFLIDQPLGRYLYFRLHLIGDGTATPIVRRVQIDFPRVTSLDHLPSIYRENPKAEDFTERFLALFDASIADIDRAIERYPALLDPSGVPEQLLPWLGGFFDIGFDSTWDADKRRRILQNAPQLYRQRGTLAGLRQALELVFGVALSIEELSSTGTWGALSSREILCAQRRADPTLRSALHRTARVGAVRLFGKARARFRLGASPLSSTPLRSYGDPDKDPLSDSAYRLRIVVPPMPDMSQRARDALIRLIDAQKPAHTVASVRFGGAGFLLGYWSAVGVDTAFVPLARSVLGAQGNIRLSRRCILGQGRGDPTPGRALGRDSLVGIQTIAG